MTFKMKRCDIRRHGPTLFSLLKGSSDYNCQNILLSSLDDQNFRFVCDCLNRIVYKPESLNLSSAEIVKVRKALQPEKKTIVYLAKKGGNLKRKKKIIRTQSGGGIMLALSTVLPLIVSQIANLINKNKKKRS